MMRREQPWWVSESNGRTVTLGFPGNADLCQLSAPRQGMAPALLTFTTIADDGAPGDVTDRRCLIRARWGNTRNTTLNAILDAGQAVTVPATTLILSAETVGTVVGPPGAVPTLHVGVFVGEASSHATPGDVTFTDFLQHVAAGATTALAWPVPPLAQGLVLASSYDASLFANPLRVQWSQDSGSFAGYLEQLTGGASTSSQRITVPRGARSMRVINGGAATNLQPIWILSL